jgi:hypothetical protein
MQLSIDFEPGLTEQFATLEDVCAAAVYGSPSGLKRVAGACDVSPSVLSRMLSRAEGKRLPAAFVAPIVKETGDCRPVYWLVETFLRDPQERQHALIDQGTRLMTRLADVLATLKRERDVAAVRSVAK